MAEVGVLNLEVNANTGPAEEKLVKLGDALKRVKEAVSGGLKLSGVARQVKSIADAVNDNISDSTISKIGRLADELSKLKGFENVRINIRVNNAISGAIEELETGYEQVQEYNDKLEQVGATVSSAKDSVDNFANSVTRANEVIQNMSMQNDGWMAWFDLFKQKLNDFLRMRSAMALGAGPETGLATSWKNGAIEAEGTVTDACEVIEGTVSGTCESINNNLEGTRQVLLESGENGMRVFSSLEEAATYFGVSIDDIKKKLQETHDTVYGQKNQMNVFTSMEDAARALGITVDEVKQKLQETYDRIYGVQKAAPTPEISNAVTAAADKAISNSSTAASNAVNRVKDSVDSLIRNTSKVSLLTRELETLKGKLQQTIDMGGTQEEIDRVLKKILQVKEALKKEKVGGELFTDLKNTIKNIFPMIADLLHRLKNAAIRRAMNTILRGLWSGLKEGVQNVYEYSKAIGSSFAPAMDSAASSILQMKNSLGAAVAPLIQSIIPYLQIVVKWFIDAVNWANQFISLMRGQSTWTRAVPATATAFGKQEKAAKGAAAAVKDLLADWDELNIIQSETSGAGSGAGTSAAEDYLNMFEEVGTFDNDVRKVVDYIKDNFDDILKIAELVGAAVLAWKISGAFAGVLGTIAGLAGAVFNIALVFTVSKELSKQFLKTGDEGYLVADVVTTLLGGLATKALLDRVISTGAGKVGLFLTFAVSAGATIIANIEETDVGALSKESIEADVAAALEGAGAGATLGYMVGNTLGSAIAGGAVGLLTTFGIAIGLKANAEVIADGITPENIKAKLLGIASLGLGGATLGAVAEGGGAAAAAGMAMLFMGVPVATFGASIGIHAVNKVVDGSGITADVVKENFIAGGLVGAGLLISTIAVAGATTAGIVGATAGALTVAALFVIEAIIDKQPAKITWGSYEATKEEIETFVNDELMKTPPSVTISLINATIEPLGEAKSKLEADASNVIGTVYALSVGVKTTTDDLKTQIDDLVTSFNTASEQYQNTLTVALNLAPVQSSDGTDASGQIVKNSAERWQELNGIMAGLGEELADAYKVAYDARMNGNIDDVAEETVKKISDMMTRVANAIASGQARAKAGHALRMQMTNLSKDSMGSLLDEVRKQRDLLIEELTKARTESAEGILAQQYAYEELAAYALEDAGGDVTDATYKHYLSMAEQAKNEYKSMLETMQEDVKKAADNLLDPETLEELRQAALGFMDRDIDLGNWLGSMGNEVFEGYLELFQGQDSVLFGKKGKQNVYDLLVGVIQASFENGDRDTVKKAIDAGVLKFSDFVNQEIIDSLASTLGLSGDAKELWDKYVAELLGLNEDNTTPPVSVTPQVSVEEPEIVGTETSGAELIGESTQGAVEQAKAGMQEVKESVRDAAAEVNNTKFSNVTLDATSAVDSANQAASAIENMAKRIRDAFASLDGLIMRMT